jgi:hypothetical protein
VTPGAISRRGTLPSLEGEWGGLSLLCNPAHSSQQDKAEHPAEDRVKRKISHQEAVEIAWPVGVRRWVLEEVLKLLA